MQVRKHTSGVKQGRPALLCNTYLVLGLLLLHSALCWALYRVCAGHGERPRAALKELSVQRGGREENRPPNSVVRACLLEGCVLERERALTPSTGAVLLSLRQSPGKSSCLCKGEEQKAEHKAVHCGLLRSELRA